MRLVQLQQQQLQPGALCCFILSLSLSVTLSRSLPLCLRMSFCLLRYLSACLSVRPSVRLSGSLLESLPLALFHFLSLSLALALLHSCPATRMHRHMSCASTYMLIFTFMFIAVQLFRNTYALSIQFSYPSSDPGKREHRLEQDVLSC